MTIADNNRKAAERADRIRNQEFADIWGWHRGIRLASVMSVQPTDDGIAVLCGWHGASSRFVFRADIERTGDAEKDAQLLMAAKEAMAMPFMGVADYALP